MCNGLPGPTRMRSSQHGSGLAFDLRFAAAVVQQLVRSAFMVAGTADRTCCGGRNGGLPNIMKIRAEDMCPFNQLKLIVSG